MKLEYLPEGRGGRVVHLSQLHKGDKFKLHPPAIAGYAKVPISWSKRTFEATDDFTRGRGEGYVAITDTSEGGVGTFYETSFPFVFLLDQG